MGALARAPNAECQQDSRKDLKKKRQTAPVIRRFWKTAALSCLHSPLREPLCAYVYTWECEGEGVSVCVCVCVSEAMFVHIKSYVGMSGVCIWC